MQYFFTLNDKEIEVRSRDELRALLERTRQQDVAEVWLRQITGRMKGFEAFIYRMLGLGQEVEGKSMGILFSGDVATLTFLNSAGDEFIGLTASSAPDENVEFLLGTGQRVAYPARECVPASEAERAMLHFFDHGKRPAWLHWRKSA